MKTAEEILKDVCLYETEVTHKEAVEIAETYADQFKPKWIKINSVDDLPSIEGKYLTFCKTDYHPFYRKDVFCGRLSNAVHHVTGSPIFSHYAVIEFPDTPM